MVWACIEKPSIKCEQDSDCDGGTRERRRGRPKRKWLDNFKNNLSERTLPGPS